jgi:6-phospho-beta-glucosidase
MAPQLRVIAGAIASVAPDAWVLNLTNPLSVATSILSEEGVKLCIGLCELPSSTAGMVATLLDLPPSRLDWDYRGLNHRGFIVGLKCDGQDQLPRLLVRLGDGNLGGIPAAAIATLGAVPMKYFALVQGAHGPAPGRAEYVRGLRDRIVQELRSAPHVLPPSLRMRRLPWYAKSVVPALASLRSSKTRRLVVNLRCEDGITREMYAALSAAAVTGEAPPAVPATVRDYLEQFELHERRVLEAVANPSYETVASALAVDPTLAPGASSALANAVWANYARLAADVPSHLELR